ncbi:MULTISPECIES: hypothetical protein [unclassified Nonomuraea]|uniref:hypothetical protein n=1 Tax=unclassified Nonomuraea TaxID=2593643 RepID=UPI0033CEF66D
MLDLEAGQHVAGDPDDAFADHPVDIATPDPFQQVGQSTVAGNRHAEPCVVLRCPLAAAIQAQHAGLDVPEMGDEVLAWRQSLSGVRISRLAGGFGSI